MKLPTWVRLLVLAVLIVAIVIWGLPQDAGDSGSNADDETAPETVGTPTTPATPVDSGEAWLVEFVVDGDTIEVSRDGVQETVRFIGIDTPERDECGYADARSALEELVDGRTVTLLPGAPTDRDNYDRMLRYVEVDGVDAGLWMLENGYAAEVYDSRRGKPHDREEEYIAADDAAADVCVFDAG